MDEYVDLRILEKLIEIEIKILESYQLLFVFKDVSIEKWLDEYERLNVLIKKENVILDKLPQHSEVMEAIYSIIVQNKYNFFDDEEIADSVMCRLSTILCDLGGMLFDKEEKELLEEDDAYFLCQSVIQSNIRDNILVKYLVTLEESLNDADDDFKPFVYDAQFSEAFCYKNVGDFLIKNKLDFSSISYREDEEMAKTLKTPLALYSDLKNQELLNLMYDVFFDLLEVDYDDKEVLNSSKVVCDILKFKFFVLEMPTPLLMSSVDFVLDEIHRHKPCKFLDRVYGVIKDEISMRKDIPVVNDEINPSTNPVDEQTARAIIGLIKIDEQIFKLFNTIDFDAEDNLSKIRQLSFLVDMEKELISNVKLNFKNIDVIEDMLANDMDFFFSEEEKEEHGIGKCDLIHERIQDLFPFYKKLVVPIIQSQVSFDCINQSHLISTLKKYKSLILEIEKRANSMPTSDYHAEKLLAFKRFYRNLFFVSSKLTDDYICADGNYEIIESFSDDLLALSIGISGVEYAYDKDEQLYELAKVLIDEILYRESKWDGNLDILAALEFKLLEIDDIIRNIDDEHVYELLYLVEDDNRYSEKAKRKLLSVMNKKGYIKVV